MNLEEFSESDEKSRDKILKISVNCSQMKYIHSIQLQVNLFQYENSSKNATILCNNTEDMYIKLKCGVPYRVKLFWIYPTNISRVNECVLDVVNKEVGVDCSYPTGKIIIIIIITYNNRIDSLHLQLIIQDYL